MATDRRDPYLANRFTVALEIDGVTQASFSECSGLTAEVELEERREGGVNAFAHKLPRGTKYSNLVLKRGITDSDDLWRWHQGTIDGDVKEKSLSIALLDSSGNEQWRWNLERAVPVKWAGPDFKSDGSTVAIETLELAHHGLRKG